MVGVSSLSSIRLNRDFTESEKAGPARRGVPSLSPLGLRRSLATLPKARSMTRSSTTTVIPRDLVPATPSPNQRQRGVPSLSPLGLRRSLATLPKARSMTRSSTTTVIPRDLVPATPSPNQRQRSHGGE